MCHALRVEHARVDERRVGLPRVQKFRMLLVLLWVLLLLLLSVLMLLRLRDEIDVRVRRLELGVRRREPSNIRVGLSTTSTSRTAGGGGGAAAAVGGAAAAAASRPQRRQRARLQHVEPEVDGAARDDVLAHVVEIEAHVPEELVADPAVARLGARDARAPHACERRERGA